MAGVEHGAKSIAKFPEAILFDLDDTILSYDGVNDIAWEKICGEYIERCKPAFAAAALLESLGHVRRWYWSDPERHRIGRLNMLNTRKMIIRMAFERLQHDRLEHADELAEGFEKELQELLHLFPNSIETLDALKEQGIRMALITNGTAEKQRWKINRFDLLKYFEFCLIEEEVGYGKPDVRVFELALELMGLKAEQVWMVGDNLKWDVEAPQSIGIYSIWNDYRKTGLPEDSTIQPDRTIHDISELLIR